MRTKIQTVLTGKCDAGRVALAAIGLALVLVVPAFSQSKCEECISPASVLVEKESVKVNPLTGMVSTSSSNYKSPTAEQRWKLYFKQNYWSMGAFVGPFASALIFDQAGGDPEEWGGGMEGYARRLGSRLATGAVQGTFQAPVAALLGEDTRYIVSDKQGFKSRLGHALLYGFLTYNKDGHPTLNIAGLGGYYAASAMSTLWLPGERNRALYTLSDGSRQAGLGSLVNLIQEFWSEIQRAVGRRH